MSPHISAIQRAALATTVLVFAIGLAGCAASAPPSSTGPSASGVSSTSGASDAATSAPSAETTVQPISGTEAEASGFTSGADTAQGHYNAAEKSMKAVQPDAVFIVAQTPGVISADPSPEWIYLFASKKTNKGYAVTIAKGKSDKPLEISNKALLANEWAKIPPVSDWKIDSDVALEKASAAYTQRFGAKPPVKYGMAMPAFVSDSAANKATGFKNMVWMVMFDPEGKARPIQVDAQTGEVLPASK
jgi:hypothetical protein